MDALPPMATLNGKFSAYCGVCWHPTFSLWVAAETPDYTRCPLGDYTAQTCPNAVSGARTAAFFADPKNAHLFAGMRGFPAENGASSPSAASAGKEARDDQ